MVQAGNDSNVAQWKKHDLKFLRFFLVLQITKKLINISSKSREKHPMHQPLFQKIS